MEKDDKIPRKTLIKANFTLNNEGAKYYFTEALGSTTALANPTATNKYDYDSWGKVSTAQSSNNARLHRAKVR